MPFGHKEKETAHSALCRKRDCAFGAAHSALLGKEIAHSALGKGDCAFGAAHSALRKRRLRIRRCAFGAIGKGDCAFEL